MTRAHAWLSARTKVQHFSQTDFRPCDWFHVHRPEPDATGNRKLDKAKNQGRIDGLVALAMAVSAAMIRPPQPVFQLPAGQSARLLWEAWGDDRRSNHRCLLRPSPHCCERHEKNDSDRSDPRPRLDRPPGSRFRLTAPLTPRPPGLLARRRHKIQIWRYLRSRRDPDLPSAPLLVCKETISQTAGKR